MIISTAIIKGGTGKTTTAVALGQAGRSKGRKVLFVDLDPQGNLTRAVTGTNKHDLTAYDLLHGTELLDVVITSKTGADVIPSGSDLASEETTTGSVTRLSDALETVRTKYDYIIIDTPPFIGELLFNAVYASDLVVTPLDPDIDALTGFHKVVEIIDNVDALDGTQDTKVKVVVTKYDQRSNLNRKMLEVIERKVTGEGADVLGTVRPGIAIKEATTLSRDIYAYCPKSKPATDYMNVYTKIEKLRKRGL